MAVVISRGEILRLRLRRDRTAPRVARGALAGLGEIGPIHDDALLVASELATEAVLDSDGGAEIEFVAELVPDGLRIAVSNPISDRRAARGGARSALPDGPGMRIVRALARRWGAERADSERVWAVLGM
jgi:hypothetical protein